LEMSRPRSGTIWGTGNSAITYIPDPPCPPAFPLAGFDKQKTGAISRLTDSDLLSMRPQSSGTRLLALGGAEGHSKRRILKDVFGFDEFRPGQEQVVDALLGGRSVLTVMPTGSGKSLCFQVPALVLGGLTVVVSP